MDEMEVESLVEVHVLAIVSLCLASFSLGMSIDNLIHMIGRK